MMVAASEAERAVDLGGGAFKRDLTTRSLEYYGGRPGYDCDAAFLAAMQDNTAILELRPNSSPYYISSPIQFVQPKTFRGALGAKIEARPGFTGSGMLSADYGYYAGTGISAMAGLVIEGDFTLDAKGYARRTIYLPWVMRASIHGHIKCLGAIAGADNTPAASVELGPDPAITGAVSSVVAHKVTGSLEIRAPGTRAYDAAHLTRGFWARSQLTDSVFHFIEAIGYNVGIDNDGANNFYHNAHPWTDDRYQAMKYGIRTTTAAQFIQPYADTPSDLGDTSVGTVYGMFVDAYGVSITQFTGFLNAAVSGSSGIAKAIYLNKVAGGAGANVTINGAYVSSSSPSKKWSHDVDGNSFALARNSAVILGVNTDGNVNTIQGANLISSLNLVLRPIFQGSGTPANDGINFNAGAVTKASVLALSAASFPRRAYWLTDPAAGKFPQVASDGTNWLYTDGTTVS